ncbi:MAG TPA: ATP-binding protein [Xanthomonadaceae bacterium]|nr:ATP-binding protein [Xanthomonadaceae bacterium]
MVEDATGAALATERLQLALDAGAIIGTWVWTVPDDRFIADERFAFSFGLGPEAVREGLPLRVLFESIHPDDRARVAAAVDAALAQGGRYRCDYRVRRHDGAYAWVIASGRVELDAQGRAVRFPGVLIDDSERRTIEAERDRANALLHTFIEAVPGVVYAKDRDGRLILGNRGVAELLGVAPNAFVGKTDLELIADPDQARRVMENDRRIMDSGVAEQVEEHIDFPDGTRAIWLSTKAPMRDAQGQVIGLIGTSLDITDRKRMLEALEESDRRKDEFLAMLAHELRNPMAPISTAAQLLQLAPADPARVGEMSEVILRQVMHMTSLVDDLLDVSRVTRGLVAFERERVDLRTVFALATEQVAPLVRARGQTLAWEPGACSAVVVGDRHRLVQVVSNLLNNAAKYTPHGGRIVLACECTPDQVRVRVTDDGIGMEPELVPVVFDLFTQAARGPDRALGGLGIGLALVRTIVHAHDGTVTAHSDGPGQGSTFTVALPRATGEAPAACTPPSPRRPARGQAVLIVDDNADAAATLASALRVLGHDVAVALDGRQALTLAEARPDWDAFILDIGMPDITGLELARELRRRIGDRPARFIALTGYGQAQDHALTREAGFDHHIVKPGDVEEIHRQLSGGEAAEAA